MAFIDYPIENEITITALISAFEKVVEGGFFFKGEHHEHWEMVYVISGQIGVSANEKIFKLSEGEIIFHKPWEFHKIWSETENIAQVFIMAFKITGSLAKTLENCVLKLSDTQQHILHLMISAFQACNVEPALVRFPDFFNNWNLSSNAAIQIAKNYAEILFLDIIQNQNKPKRAYKTRTSEIYQQIIGIMEEHISDWITIDDIAKKCNFSTAYIKKVFAKYSDCGIHNYFLKLKLQRAVIFLKNGKSIQQTSNLLSFSSTNYFSVVFKREFGMSPRNYIKQVSRTTQ